MEAIERGGVCKASPSMSVTASVDKRRDLPLSERLVFASPANPFSRYCLIQRCIVERGICCSRASCVWGIWPSKAGRKSAKRSRACVRCASERLVSGGDAFVVIERHVPQKKSQLHHTSQVYPLPQIIVKKLPQIIFIFTTL